MKREIELLAPAKNLKCGIEAISHGADAVYIGASEFGARQAAGNNISDIAKLTEYAHRFGAKVYVTVNTIIYETELEAVRKMLKQLGETGVDAILVQDMAVVQIMHELEAEGIRMPQIHASTQTDNRCAKKVEWLKEVGFSRVVLARELSSAEIKEIHKAVPDVELEAFVHGALCVSYSGACYASEHCFHRSANRGECAQFCRLTFNLIDSGENVIKANCHLLSLKDMRQIDRLEEIVDAGVTSLKIEGRLKDSTYVKNVVAAYSQRLNHIIKMHPDKYIRSSFGHCEYTFEPNLDKTFNRGFTNYFLDGRKGDISSFDTPKAMGEYVGYVKEIRHNSFNVAGTSTFANGDGLCFFTKDGQLKGFRVNRAENNRLFPLSMPHNLKPGMRLYRNNDMEFERMMNGNTAERKLEVDFTLSLCGGKLLLTATDEAQRTATATLETKVEEAQKPQRDNIIRQIGKLGNTDFKARSINFADDTEKLFMPSSKLADLRREVIERLAKQPIVTIHKTTHNNDANAPWPRECIKAQEINAANVANHIAEEFYKTHGVTGATSAYETASFNREDKRHYAKLSSPQALMTCRFCLRYALGYCTKNTKSKPQWKEPLYLESSDKKRVRLVFNCRKCQMEVWPE